MLSDYLKINRKMTNLSGKYDSSLKKRVEELNRITEILDFNNSIREK